MLVWMQFGSVLKLKRSSMDVALEVQYGSESELHPIVGKKHVNIYNNI